MLCLAAASAGYQTAFQAPPRRRAVSRPALNPVASTYQEYIAAREAKAKAAAMPAPPPEGDVADSQLATPVEPVPFVDHDLTAEIKAAAEARIAAQDAKARIAAEETAAIMAAADARLAAEAAAAVTAAQKASGRGRSAPEIIAAGFGNLLKEPLGWCFGPPSPLYSNVGAMTSPTKQVYFFAVVLMLSTMAATIVGSTMIRGIEVTQAQQAPTAQQAQSPSQPLLNAIVPKQAGTAPSAEEVEAAVEKDAAEAEAEAEADADAAADSAGVSDAVSAE